MPTIVKGLSENIVNVYCGSWHTLVLCEKGILYVMIGRVYSFGSGLSGQLGRGDKENGYIPQLVFEVKLINQIRIKT